MGEERLYIDVRESQSKVVKPSQLSLAFSPLVLATLTPLSTETERAPSRQAELGQYMTPPGIATYMASLFDAERLADVHLLDAGAGRGALSSAFATRWAANAPSTSSLTIQAFEIDGRLAAELRNNLLSVGRDRPVTSVVSETDFIEAAAVTIRSGKRPYTHAILNPPYKKISSNSEARRILSSVDIETVNLYSGFVALALRLIRDGGELVAIIPRSFCNGPYYKPFRDIVLAESAIKSIHLFHARDKAFASDGVLQENIIIRLERGGRQGDVVVTTSTDASFLDATSRSLQFDRIVRPGDSQRFIHIPLEDSGVDPMPAGRHEYDLADIGVSVSTGPVVDFRAREHLRAMTSGDDAPLIYPAHLKGGKLDWPKKDFRKANAIAVNEHTSRLLYPRGYYVAVKRFSSKEEKRRVVAALVDPDKLAGPFIGFENHLNVFHLGRKPLAEYLARGLVIYLNTKMVDDRLRQFSGHTQVNATDLRSLSYPSRDRLEQLGRWSVASSAKTPAEAESEVAREP